MAFLSPPTRALSHQLSSRAVLRSASRPSCNHTWSRVAVYNLGCLNFLLQFDAAPAVFSRFPVRSYATKPGKPKAHTGRAVASAKKPAVVRSDATAGTPKKAPAKRTRKPSAKKPARKSKVKTKAKAKAKPKAKSKRKPLTEEQKAIKAKKDEGKKKRELRAKALLDRPKRLPATAYQVLLTETSSNVTKFGGEATKAASAQYKNLTPEERERLNHVANENKAKNDEEYKKWLATHTPTDIHAANVARRSLNRETKKEGKKGILSSIKDERLVKQSRVAYTWFLKDRFASGDMKNMKIDEVGALIGREWKALSPADKKPYEDKAVKDKARYIEEYTTVYGKPPALTKVKKAV